MDMVEAKYPTDRSKSITYFVPLSFMKHIYIFVFSVLSIILIVSCKQEAPLVNGYRMLQGETMGTTYSVKYFDTLEINYAEQIDSILEIINSEVSTYIETSTISLYNSSDSGFVFTEQNMPVHFAANFKLSEKIARQSQGAFDHTVMPLVNYWGFGYTGKKPVTKIDSSEVEKILDYVGYRNALLVMNINPSQDENPFIYSFEKQHPKTQIDFSAIAKGYAVDQIAEFLLNRSIENLLVEIGGETFCGGFNQNGSPWTVGIQTPDPNASQQSIEKAIQLSNKALATSGNYRNFYVVDGISYAHTIHPETGFPQKNALLSASIKANTCAQADALATACMVKGLDDSMYFIEQLKDVEGYFIYTDGKQMLSKQTSGF